MTATNSLDVFDSTVQQTYEWLTAIGAELRWPDRRRQYLALRSVLHALRDYLLVNESAQLAAQLPLLIRGVYYEGWNPARAPAADRSRADFLGRIERDFARADPNVDPERVAHAVLRVLSDRVSAGEIDEARHLLPKDVRTLWAA
ncbi:MAG TPA: DUF2267 domain-containing protein [Thermomicrobiales bacterium]|nr:DUF2267 domain-containing protein [Thermomicrobiales bacterium]